jgi:hypothetical protein
MRANVTSVIALCGGLALATAAAAQEMDHSQMDHSQMDHSQMDHSQMDHSQMDHSGHDMSQEEYRILRSKIRSYQTMTDAEIMQNMMMMPPTYERYISDTSLQGDLGVIVLAHGAGEPGDTFFANSLTGLASEYPTTIGFGMAMMNGNHLQTAVDNLAEAGAKNIVVVPAALSASGSVYEQWAYYFGEREEASYLPAPRVNQTVPVTLGVPQSSHTLITDMLLDHAVEISKNPENELLIIIGHGPEGYEDNVLELQVLDTHADRIRAKGIYADVRAYNLQDDAPDQVRDNNVEVMRGWIDNAKFFGKDVIIVGYLLSTRGIQANIGKDFEGLDYTFNEKGLSSHPNFAKWIEAGVAEYAGRM